MKSNSNPIPKPGDMYVIRTSTGTTKDVTVTEVYFDDHKKDHRVKYRHNDGRRNDSMWYARWRQGKICAPALTQHRPSPRPQNGTTTNDAVACALEKLSVKLDRLIELWQPSASK